MLTASPLNHVHQDVYFIVDNRPVFSLLHCLCLSLAATRSCGDALSIVCTHIYNCRRSHNVLIIDKCLSCCIFNHRDEFSSKTVTVVIVFMQFTLFC